MKPALTVLPLLPILALGALAAPPGAARAAGSPAAADLPPAVQAAMEAAVIVAGAQVVPRSYTPTLAPGCRATAASLPRPIGGSGRFAVQLTGAGCRGWAWLEVEVWAPASITTRAVRAGEPLAGAVTTTMRPVSAGHAPVVVAPGAVAARSLPRGKTVLESDLRRAGGAAGQTVKVLVVSGPLAIETSGRVVSCGRGRVCAVLPAGKHVEGQFVDGRLLVEVP